MPVNVGLRPSKDDGFGVVPAFFALTLLLPVVHQKVLTASHARARNMANNSRYRPAVFIATTLPSAGLGTSGVGWFWRRLQRLRGCLRALWRDALKGHGLLGIHLLPLPI